MHKPIALMFNYSMGLCIMESHKRRKG